MPESAIWSSAEVCITTCFNFNMQIFAKLKLITRSFIPVRADSIWMSLIMRINHNFLISGISITALRTMWNILWVTFWWWNDFWLSCFSYYPPMVVPFVLLKNLYVRCFKIACSAVVYEEEVNTSPMLIQVLQWWTCKVAFVTFKVKLNIFSGLNFLYFIIKQGT